MPSKDFPALLQAMAAVRRKLPNVRLRIIGEGYERPKLEQRIAELDAVEWCTIEGRGAGGSPRGVPECVDRRQYLAVEGWV